jgi:hypothetical protein
MRRTLATVVLTAAFLVAWAQPASAHNVAGVSATNYRTTFTGLVPPVPGLEMRVVEAGSRLELTNASTAEVVVLGYQREPYLRVGPQGVFENRRSPSTYVNRSRNGGTVPGTADPAAPPEWRKVSSGHVVRWHDHRAHHMGTTDPPTVRRAPGRHQILNEWKVEMQQGSVAIEAKGVLEWVPGPSPFPWLAVALVTLAVVALVARREPVLAALLALLLVIDVAHAIGVGFEAAGGLGDKLRAMAGGSVYSVPVWIVAAVAVRMLVRRRPDALLGALFAGILLALLGGLIDITDLSRSQVPFAGPVVVVRAMVALTIGLGFGIAAAAGLGLRALRPVAAPAGDTPAG